MGGDQLNKFPEISDIDLEKFSDLLLESTGIFLDTAKRYLFESRLSPMLLTHNLPSYGHLYDKAINPDARVLKEAIIDALTTHETSFFRDEHPFKLLKNCLIPRFLRCEGTPVMRLASGPCSTGQEAYSAAIIASQISETEKSFDYFIDGFDISSRVVMRAQIGEYSQFEVGRGLGSQLASRYTRLQDGKHTLVDEIKQHVKFFQANLLNHDFGNARYHIFFCRNVVNYLSDDSRVRVFNNVYRALKPGGVMVLGATESIGSYDPARFRREIYDGSVYFVKLA